MIASDRYSGTYMPGSDEKGNLTSQGVMGVVKPRTSGGCCLQACWEWQVLNLKNLQKLEEPGFRC